MVINMLRNIRLQYIEDLHFEFFSAQDIYIYLFVL